MATLKGIWCGAALRETAPGHPTLSGPCALHIADGRIAAIGQTKPTELSDWLDVPAATVAPGLVDVQVNGALGHSFQATDAAHYEAIVGYHAARGTTALLPTLVTAPESVLLASLRALSHWIGVRTSNGPVVAGIHLEGPFLAPTRSGAHDPAALRAPDLALAARLIEAAGGTLKLVTLAPELPGALDLIALFVRAGVTVSLGHSAAGYDQVRAAVDAGATLVTHAGNASDWPHRRANALGFSGSEPGLVGAFLALPQLCGSVIADGFHVHPALVRMMHQVKGTQALLLTSDASTVTGCLPGDYDTGGLHARVDARGFATSLRGVATSGAPGLAGSTITLSDAVLRAHELSGIALNDALVMASATPAQAIGAHQEHGSLRVGARADLVVLDADLRVDTTLIAGSPYCA